MTFDVDRLVLVPDDIDLARSPLAGHLGVETYVLGAFNPALTRLPNGNLLMMVRVAEALRQPVRDGTVHAIRWDEGRFVLDAWPLLFADSADPRGSNFDVDHDYFERPVWPALAHRFPAFEACRCRRTWAGLYEQNELDGNPVIGNWESRLANFYVVAGFSGHGMMHAPAAGRAIAERIVHGRFETIDLTRLGYRRIAEHAPYPERGIL